MKDFDAVTAERNTLDVEARTFKLRGETFTIRPAVRAETLVAASRITTESNPASDIVAFDELIEGFLEPDDRDRYRDIRARETDPVTFTDLMAISMWMIETNSGRPNDEQSGRGPTDAPRSAVSPLPAETQTG